MGAGISYAGYRTGFPFPIRYDATIWDGTTYDVGGLPGDGSGGIVVGNGTAHPLGFTFKQMTEYWWRVRKLKTALDLSFGIDVGTQTGTGDAEIDWFTVRTDVLHIDQIEVAQTDLWKLVRGDVPFVRDEFDEFVVGSYSTTDGEDPPTTFYGNVTSPTGGAIGFSDLVYKVDGLYYPNLVTSEVFTFVDLDIFFIYSTAGSTRTAVHTATFADVGTFTLYKDDGVDHTISGTYDILPVEWFGYGATWNTTNGLRL
jgi:hypothetical protein